MRKLDHILICAALILVVAVLLQPMPSIATDDNETNQTNDSENTAPAYNPNENLDILYTGWVQEGKSFTVDGKEYAAAAGESTTSVILMGSEGVFVIDKDYCKTIGSMKFCLEDFRYTVGGSVKVHGSDTQEFLITVYQPGAVIAISRDIDEDVLKIGDSAEVTIEIKNNGDEPARTATYTEIIPPEFEVTNTNGIDAYGNKLMWTGALASDYTKTMSYNIRAKSRFAGKIVATLDYKTASGSSRKTTSNLGVRVDPTFNININAEKMQIEAGEEDRFYVIAENKKDVESMFYLEVVVPANLKIDASHINTSSGNTLLWNGTLAAGEEKQFNTDITGLVSGPAVIKVTLKDDLGSTTKELNLTVSSQQPEIYFVHDKFYPLNNSVMKVYIKNINTYFPIQNIEISVESDLFNKTGEATKFNPKEYNQILSADFVAPQPGRYKVTATMRYKLQGKELNRTEQDTFDVIDPNKATGAAKNETQPAPEAKKEPSPEAKAFAEKVKDIKSKVSLFQWIKKNVFLLDI